MRKAAVDPAQMLLLAFEDIDSATWALHELRELRRHAVCTMESIALLRREAGGDRSCNVEVADRAYPEGALIAALADVLMGAITDRPVETRTRESVGAPGKKTALKRIDRGICSARLKPLRSYLPPGCSAIVALVRESDMTQLASALANSRAIADAREVWVDLELDLDLLIADVVGPRAVFGPITVGAGLLGMAGSHISTELRI